MRLRLFMSRPARFPAPTYILEYERGCGEDVVGARRRLLAGGMRGGAGPWNFDRGHLSNGLSAVYRRVSSDRLREFLPATLIETFRMARFVPREDCMKGVRLMKIVVWKSPKALCGLLRRMFGIKE